MTQFSAQSGSYFSLLAVVLGLSGCSNMLYSDTNAPVYSSTSAKSRGTPSVLNTSVTPLPSSHRGTYPRPANTASVPTTQSIEKPVRPNRGMAVNTSQNNPYGTRPVATTVTTLPQPPTAVTYPANRVPTTNNTVTTTTAPTAALPTATNPTISSNDPRIKEGSAVLASQQAGQTTVSGATNAASIETPAAVATATRPSAVTQAAKNRVQQTAKTTMNQTTSKATNAAESANTATKQVSRVTPTKPAATQPEASVKPAKPVAKAPAEPAKTSPAKTPTATTALLQEARVAVAAGSYDKAASALERAHRIEPGNAKILYDIAQIRYAQGKYRQAESFASKAANYSGSKILSKKIWNLLSNSRRALGNASGAESAAKKAATF